MKNCIVVTDVVLYMTSLLSIEHNNVMSLNVMITHYDKG